MFKGHKKINLWLFLAGLGSFTQTNFIIGYFSFSEVALCLFAPVLLFKNVNSLSGSYFKPIFGLLCLWFMSAVVSDIYNHASFIQYSKGLARVLIIGGCLTSLFILLRKDLLGYRYFAVGLAFSIFLGFFVFKSGTVDAIEKFQGSRGIDYESTYGYILSGALTAFAAVCYRRIPYVVILAFVAVGCLDILQNVRSGGALKIAVAGVIFFYQIQRSGARQKSFNLTYAKMFALCVLGVIGMFLTLFVYSYLAKNSYLGDKAREQYYTQSKSKLGLIMGSRPQVYAAVCAVVDKPILGHGSDAYDVNGYWDRAVVDLRLPKHQGLRESYGLLGYIPAHSHVFQAWMEHGLFGGVFWGAVLIFYVRFIKNSMLVVPDLLPIVSLIVINSLWHYIFSPFGFRVPLAGQIALIIAISDFQKKSMMRRVLR